MIAVWRRLALLLLPVALLLALSGLSRSAWAGAWPYRIGLVGWLADVGQCATVKASQVILHLRPVHHPR